MVFTEHGVLMLSGGFNSQNAISVLGKNGGYMIAPAHIPQNDVSPNQEVKRCQIRK